MTELAVVPCPQSNPKPRKPAVVAASARLERLEAQLKQAHAAERAALTRQAAIVGKVVIAALPENPTLRALVSVLLLEKTSKAERAEIVMLIETERIKNAPDPIE